MEYLFSDFKKHDGYKHSIELSKQYNLYRQNYCGCKFANNQNIFLSLAYLKGRYCKESVFPHEIGLFLGYPPEDVKGFIENKGRNFLMCAYWKEYVNEQEAKKIFDKYASCSKKFCEKLSSGASILDLSVEAC